MHGDPLIAHLSAHLGTPITIHQAALAIGKSYGWTYYHARQLAQDNIITLTRIGKALVCTLNFTSETAIGMLVLCSSEKAEIYLREHADIAERLRSIKAHMPSAATIGVDKHGIIVLTRDKLGRHTIDGHEIRVSTINKETWQSLATGTLLHGHEAFWRLGGEHHA
jgi:hypothetical protein